eukprot:UN03632
MPSVAPSVSPSKMPISAAIEEIVEASVTVDPILTELHVLAVRFQEQEEELNQIMNETLNATVVIEEGNKIHPHCRDMYEYIVNYLLYPE